jgi:hypothetical protein
MNTNILQADTATLQDCLSKWFLELSIACQPTTQLKGFAKLELA